MTERKGASRPSAVPPAILAQLNAGTLATATLSESLAMDLQALLRAVAPELPAGLEAQLAPEIGITKRMALGGQLLLAHYGLAALPRFAAHTSDTVRGWAAYMLAAQPGMALAERLERVRPLANDGHFGVREWAWLALRPHIAADLDTALALLEPWTLAASANVRRFAVESTRPRGVWCAHIAALKAQPERGLALLEPLQSDPARYVQDSVANWLNDAAKSQPQWVAQLCADWRSRSASAATSYICRRATRSLKQRAQEEH